MLNADFLSGLQDGGPIHLAGAEGDIVDEIGVASQGTERNTFPEVFEVHELPATFIFFHQFHRVLTGINNPENVHLIAHELRLGFLHEKVKEVAVSVRLKLVTVAVVEKGDTFFGECFSRAVERGDGVAAGFFGEVAFVVDPSATRILQAECFGITNDGVEVFLVALVREVTAHSFEAA